MPKEHKTQKKPFSFINIILTPFRILVKSAIWIFVTAIVFAFVAPRFIPVEKIIPIPKVNQIITEKTGLSLQLNGKTRLSILPFVGITAHNVQLTNEKFPKKNVLLAKKIEIKVAVFPILTGKIIVKNITLDTAQINIIKCNNAFNFFAPLNKITKIEDKQTQHTQEDSSTLFYFRDITLSNFTITNGAISYSECNSNESYNINNIDAKISIPNVKSLINGDLTFILNGQKVSLSLKSSSLYEALYQQKGNIHINMDSDLGKLETFAKYNFDQTQPTFFNNANIEIKAQNISPQNIAKYLHIKNEELPKISQINFNSNINITHDTINIIKAEISTNDISLSAKDISINIQDRKNINSITASGKLIAEAVNIKNILNSMKIEMPSLKKHPSEINIPLNFEFKNGIFKVNEGSKITIDKKIDIDVFAVMEILTKQQSAIINITSKEINLDEYISFASNDTKDTNPSSTKTNSGTNNTGIPIIQTLNKDPIKLFDTKSFAIDIQTNIAKLIARNIVFENLFSNIKARNGMISAKISTSIFGGKLDANTNIAEQNSLLQKIDLKIDLNNVESTYILSTFNLPPISQGPINADAIFQANGTSIHGIITNGIGNINLNAKSFIIKGIDFDSIVSDIKTDYRKIIQKSSIMRYISAVKKSSIDQISAQILLKNGMIVNSKLDAIKDTIRVSGSGQLNLYNNQVLYKVNLQNKEEPLPYFVIKGTTSDLSYTIDPKDYLIYQTKKGIQKEFLNPEIRDKITKFNNIINNFQK